MIIDTIVTDMDDTMLDGSGRLSEYTLRVVEECKRRGIRVIPCSGRTQASMYPFMKQLDTGVEYIGGNGTEIVSPEHQIMEQLTLDVELSKEIIQALLQVDFHVQAYRGDSFYYGVECEASYAYMASSKMKGIAVGDLYAFLDFPTPKILAVGTPELVAEMRPKMLKQFEGRATFTMSKSCYLEAEPIHASKGNAVRRLAEIRGDIVPERTIAFGDSLNDISLLNYTPHSVAMGNAREEVKRCAAYICCPNTEDGWARFVEEHVLHAQA